jgi:hypothetical protein
MLFNGKTIRIQFKIGKKECCLVIKPFTIQTTIDWLASGLRNEEWCIAHLIEDSEVLVKNKPVRLSNHQLKEIAGYIMQKISSNDNNEFKKLWNYIKKEAIKKKLNSIKL